MGNMEIGYALTATDVNPTYLDFRINDKDGY